MLDLRPADVVSRYFNQFNYTISTLRVSSSSSSNINSFRAIAYTVQNWDSKRKVIWMAKLKEPAKPFVPFGIHAAWVYMTREDAEMLLLKAIERPLSLYNAAGFDLVPNQV